MPLRRPSASAGQLVSFTSAAASSVRVHKSNDSHHLHSGLSSAQPHSLPLGASATPQQKIVQVLVNRLKQKLPCHSGVPLDRLEADSATQQAVDALVELSHDSLDIIAWALSELLERLAKQTDNTGQLSIEVLQSQLFILKVLSVAMASRWNQNVRSSSPSSNHPPNSAPESPVPSSAAKRSRPGPSEPASTPPAWQEHISLQEPLPLDDNCARYILSVMVLFLRQTALPDSPLMLSNRSSDIAFRDFESLDLQPSILDAQRGGQAAAGDASELSEHALRTRTSSASIKSAKFSINSKIPIPANNLSYEKTHMSLVKASLSVSNLIAKFAGRIVYHLSASNWKVVFHRLRAKIRSLASNSEEHPDTVDLHLLSHSALDRQRLLQVLHELASLLVNMKPEAQLAVAIPLRMAVWNWIDLFPAEFNDAIRSRGRMEGTPERVFDALYSLNQPGTERMVWPTLVILNCITSERLSSDFQINHFGYGGPSQKSSRKEGRFIDEIVKHANTASKLSDVALVCALDICRAATHVRGEGEIPLRLVAFDIAHEIKTALWMTSTRKPFWETDEGIDIAMFAEALVSVFRFLPEDDAAAVFSACVEPERSESVKTCAVRACLTLIQEAPRVSWQRSLDKLETTLAPRFRSIFKTAAVRRTEVDQYGNLKRIALRPKAKRISPQPLSDREVLLLGILSLWRASPVFYLKNVDASEINDWIPAAVKVWEAAVDSSIKVSTACTLRLVVEMTFKGSSSDPHFDKMVGLMKLTLPATLLSIIINLIHARTDVEAQQLWMAIAHQLLELFVRKSDVEHVKDIQRDSGRLPAFALAEIAFLVSLTSADSNVSQLAARGLRLLSHAERQPGAPVNASIGDEHRIKRHGIYDQLGDPNVMVVGRVGHQKRIRQLVRLIVYPSAAHIAVWEECYWRWRSLTELIIESLTEAADDLQNHAPMAMQDKHFQWQNLTLFLAALGGVCAQEDQEHLNNLTSMIPAQYLPDEMRVLQNPATLMENFITDLTNFLVADDRQIREIARDALGAELSPRLYSRLIKHWDEVISGINLGAGTEFKDGYSLFLEQFIAVLKLLVEHSHGIPEDKTNVDVSFTMLGLASFMARFNTPSTLRIKIKFCTLCDSISEHPDILTLQNDNSARHGILDIIMEWIQPTNILDGDWIPIQNELNLACLRTIVRLLDGLQLKALHTSTGDDSVHVMSRLFNKYLGTLLRGLQVLQLDPPPSDTASDAGSIQQKMRVSQREAELRELVITGLSHLVIANTESGFKQCLPLAYDQDVRKRTIFAHIFARVLRQGSKFDPEDRSVALARQTRLRELVKGSDMVLAIAMCEACPPSEVEVMISVLLNLFDTRPSLMSLLKLMIDREIAHTENEASLFRSNSTCTRFLSAFAKTHGYNYLRSLIIPLIKVMTAMPPGHGYDLDPAKAGEQDVLQNQKNVELVASSFLEIVSSSIPTLPSVFREICAHIAKAVNEVWPDAKFAALGAFIFLRFISPAVVAPEIVDVEVPKDDGLVIRRGLMVIAKIIQNLANNIFFGKEAHMTVLNKFLGDNIVNVTRFLSEVNKYPTAVADEEADEWFGATSDETDIIVLHRFFAKHADKIGKELLSISKPSPEGNPLAVSGKLAWDGLCALLVDLGTPLEPPKLSSSSSSDHSDYIDLMSRFAYRNTTSVQDIFVETSVPKDRPAIFIFCLSKIDVEALDIELLMFHIFKTLALPAYHDRLFEIILDCTSFTSNSEVPLQWLKYCIELIPSDIRQQFMATHILNPNTLAHKYLRRLNNVSAGTTFCGDVRTYSSITELREHVPETALVSLVYPASLEQEPSEQFREVSMKNHQMRVPVILTVGVSHLRITSIKTRTISSTLPCRPTELIPLTDVSDVYSVSTGHDLYEFIIRRSRQGVTIYFSSPFRDAIIKTIRAAKGQLKDTQPPLVERLSRFSNAPATLLHVGMLSVGLNDEELRAAAYDLLGAVCAHLNFDKSPIVASKAGFIPGDPSTFVIQLSERLAEFAPELTLDFMSDVSTTMASMDKSTISQRINCLRYMSPWVKNLVHFPNPTSSLYERSGARLRDCIRVLSDLSIADPEIAPTLQKYIWIEIGKLDSVIVGVILDELIRAATDGGIGTRRCESIAHIIASLSSISVRGRLFSKLRKALSKSPKPSRSLVDSPNWSEISTLIRLALVAGYQSKQPSHNQLYVPEIVHLVTLTAGVGPTLVRKSVYGMIVNLLQSLYLVRADDAGPELPQLIDDCTKPDIQRLFGLHRTTPTSEYTNFDPVNDKSQLDNQESLTQFLTRILEATAGSRGLLNVWRARWMSLVTATAFQNSSAIQTRAFIALGTLATSDVDDDFLYQMLVAIKQALSQTNETDTISVVSMLRCICKIVPSLPHASRYICPLFWLAVALLQSSHMSFYIEATWLLAVTLESMEQRGMFKQGSVSSVLLDGRSAFEDVACQLDQMLGLAFDASFSFSLASIIFKGVRYSGLRESAKAVLRTLLRVTVRSFEDGNKGVNGFRDTLCPDALGYFLALIPLSTTPQAYRTLLKDCNTNDAWLPEAVSGLDDGDSVPRISPTFLGINDATTILLVTSFIGAMLSSAQGDDAETEMFYCLLSDIAPSFPETISMTYEAFQERIRDSFANSSNPSIIHAVSKISRVALQENTRFGMLRGSASTLSTVEENTRGPGRNHLNALEELGMHGLPNNLQFLPPNRGFATRIIQWISEILALTLL